MCIRDRRHPGVVPRVPATHVHRDLRIPSVLRRPLESAQFRSRKYVRTLAVNSLVGSMGRVGAAGDNAAMESYFALLQKNVLNRQRWATRDQLRLAIVTWIERTYHRRRRQRALGKLTPTEYEMIYNTTAHPARDPLTESDNQIVSSPTRRT